MPFPWHDWQFWAVTAIFLAAAGYLLREVLPIPFFSARAKRRRAEHKATLTVSAKPGTAPPAGEPRREQAERNGAQS